MADNDKERKDDVPVDEEEYQRALEVVNNPRKSRKKHKKVQAAQEDDAFDEEEKSEAVTEEGEPAAENEQDQDTEPAQDAVPPETSGTDDAISVDIAVTEPDETVSGGKDIEEAPKPKKKKSSSSNGKKKKKKSKKKKFDPVIPFCLFLAVAAIVGATLYFVLPKYMKKNIGLTVDELRVRYEQTSEYTTYLQGYNFNIPQATFTPSAVEHVDNFEATIRNSAVSHLTSIMGTCRSVDGKIMKLRVLASYSNAEDYFDFLMIYYASYLHVLYPEYDEATVRSLVATSLANVGGNETDFIVTGDYGYRTIYENRELGTYVIFEIESADALLPQEIMQ